MKFSRKVEVCGLSPVRKFYPYEVAAEAKGLKIRHLNIGQPDLPTPQCAIDAMKNVDIKILAYSPSQGFKSLREKMMGYYAKYNIHITAEKVYV